MSTEATTSTTGATSTATTGTTSTAATGSSSSSSSSSSSVNSATTIRNMDELRTKAPKVYKAMQQGIAMQIISDSQHSNDRLIKMMKENRNS